MATLRHLSAVVMLASALSVAPAAAGQVAGAVPGSSPPLSPRSPEAPETDAESAPTTADAAFDIRLINPETFQALAVRVPDGLRPSIDGRLDDEVWGLAPVQGNFVQREPDFGQPATERTEFRVLYDDTYIYFGVWIWESDPAGIIGNEMKRDSGLRRGDQLKIVIDTFHDHRNAFYFSTNPLGALKDANTVENGRTINYDWNVVYENRTTIDEHGWYVEMAVPLSQLRFATNVGAATWGLNLCRIVMRKNEESYWVPFPREWGAGGFARVSNAGVLRGLHDLRARRRLEFLPYVLPRVARDFDTATTTDTDTNLGFDMKLGVTDDLIADLTYHTDFAQVEADEEVVNNTRFSVFFPEKRQFFTESAGIFDYGKSGSSPGGEAAASDPGILPLFYSRRIGLVEGQQVPLVGGGKLTGRVGPYALGAINIATESAPVLAGGGLQRWPSANFTALRVKRNVLAKSTVGVILLNRQGGPTDYNRSAGFDAGLALGRYFMFTGLAAKTASPGLHGRDWAGVSDVLWKSDRFNYGVQYADIGAQFNPEMGFITRTDVRSTRAKAAWTPRPRWRGVRQLLLSGNLEYYENHDGRVESRTQIVEAQMQRQDSSSLTLRAVRDYDFLPTPFSVAGARIPAGGYTFDAVALTYTSNAGKRVYGSGGVEVGSFYNGERQTYRAAVNVQIGRTLLVEPNYTRNRITLPDRPTFTANILNVRVSQSFTPNLFVKGFVQYNDERRSANFNFLFWYIYKPGSDLYVVYNHGWETDLPGDRWSRARTRSLAVKMTYWLAR